MSKIEEIAEYEDEVDELYHYVLRNNLEAVKQILKKYPGEANKIFQS
jgi:phosphate uptake regulator